METTKRVGIERRGHTFSDVHVGGSARAQLGDSYLVFNQTITLGPDVHKSSQGDISVHAAITGLRSVATEVFEKLSRVRRQAVHVSDAPVDFILEAVDAFREWLERLRKATDATPSQKAQLSLISAESLLVPLSEAIYIFDQLQDCLSSLKSFNLQGTQLSSLRDRLLVCIDALAVEADILYNNSDVEAQHTQKTLEVIIKQILSSQNDLKRKFEMLEAQLSQRSTHTFSAAASTHLGAASTVTFPPEDSMPKTNTSGDPAPIQGPLREFERLLLSSWVYRRGQNQEDDMSFETFTYRTGCGSILSQITLADISIISVVGLPLCISELVNGAFYRTAFPSDVREQDKDRAGTNHELVGDLVRLPKPSRIPYLNLGSHVSRALKNPSDDLSEISSLAVDAELLLFPIQQWIEPHKEHSDGCNCFDGCKTLAVHLHKANERELPLFCVHLHSRTLQSSYRCQHRNFMQHTYCRMISARSQSGGGRARPEDLVTYFLTQYMLHLCRQRDSTTRELYDGIAALLSTVGCSCIVCGTSFGTDLYGVAVCDKGPSCRESLLDFSSNDRLKDILRSEPKVITLLLDAVLATARHGDRALISPLLPETMDMVSYLEGLQRLSEYMWLDVPWKYASNHVQTSNEDIEILARICTGYRGSLVCAPEPYKIPNLDEVEQDFLAAARPNLEASFDTYDSSPVRDALFYGTRMDQLYAILIQGLRVGSKVSSMQCGTSHGPEIYLYKEPAQALASTNVEEEFSNDSSFVKHSESVLLGCEVADDACCSPTTEGGIHLVVEPDGVMVRYVFLVPEDVELPRAHDITPTMLRSFKELRESKLVPR